MLASSVSEESCASIAGSFGKEEKGGSMSLIWTEATENKDNRKARLVFVLASSAIIVFTLGYVTALYFGR